MKEYFHLCPTEGNYYIEWCNAQNPKLIGETDDHSKFAKQIRKQTLEEVISALEEIPIADTYREAIYRTIKKLDK